MNEGRGRETGPSLLGAAPEMNSIRRLHQDAALRGGRNKKFFGYSPGRSIAVTKPPGPSSNRWRLAKG
jgi:hypothetical protein